MSNFEFVLNTEKGSLIAGASAPTKEFSTGNTGYFVNGNTNLPMVSHLTGQPLTLTIKADGKVQYTFNLTPRMFKTLSYGYHASWRSSDMRYQCQFQLVLAKSKGVVKEMPADLRKSGLAALKNSYVYQFQMVDLIGDDESTAEIQAHIDAQVRGSESAAQ